MVEQRQPLFDDFDRIDTAPTTHQESSFEFLNRIAGDYWEHPVPITFDLGFLHWESRVSRSLSRR